MLERDNEKLKKAQNRFEFYSFFKGDEKSRNYLLSMKEHLWYDVYFEYDNMNQKIVGGGLYANDFITKTLGYFYLNISPIDENKHILKYTAFEADFIKEVLGKHKKSKKEGFAEVDIQEIVLRRDGGILLIAERNREYVRQTSSVNPSYNNRNYGGSQIDYYL